MKEQLRILFVFMLVYYSIGFCQESPRRATDIFPKDFVRHRETIESKAEFENQTTKEHGMGFAPEAVISNKANSDSTKDLQKLAGVKVIDPGLFDGDNSNVVAVRSVGVLLKGDEIDHVKKHTRELQEFNSATKIPVSTVYLIGGIERAMDPIVNLINLGFSEKREEQYESALILTNTRYLPNVPKEYVGVEYSPTWLLDTEFGLILVEGDQRKLKSYFDEKGNFKLGKIKLARE